VAEGGPTLFTLETDSAWVVILVVSAVTLLAALILRRVIGRPGGLASGVLLVLPLVLPLVAAFAFEHAVLPEIAVARPLDPKALTDSTTGLLHLLFVSDQRADVVTPYVLFGSAGPWLVLIGVSVSSFMLLRRGLGALLVKGLVRRCRAPDRDVADRIDALVGDLAAKSRLRRSPEVLLLPNGISGAFAVGARRGRILLSRDLIECLDLEELEAILAHEIAHLEARDVQTVFLAGLLRDLVAWNPLAHVAYRSLLMDRELEADRRAAGMTGRPLSVASGLVKVCELMRASRYGPHLVALGFLRPGGRLKRRVTDLLALADGRVVSASAGRVPYVAAVCVVAILGLQVGARIGQEDARGLAIMWGAPAETESETWAPRSEWALHGRQQKQKVGQGKEVVRPRRYIGPAMGRPVRMQDVGKWFRAMNRWTHGRKVSAMIAQRWEARHNWEATPLLADSGPFAIYTLDRPPPSI
jgi:beta-lactamase regulating signal transducer with metallopeptidase domain